ncbi:hypothetical protein [Arachidicoccus soli]|nr:hypothetical protein [Arachidicoccus soli]
MKDSRRKIHWPTKVLSNKNYIQEVSIDGKKTSRFYARVGYYELYASQVMRSGNCLTLLSNPPVFSLDCFRNINLLEDITRFVFWTFNNAFVTNLEKYLLTLSFEEIKSAQDLLQSNPEAYFNINETEVDEELLWCKLKNENLKKDAKFSKIFQKDLDNRSIVLQLLECLINSSNNKVNDTELSSHLFLEMVNPVFNTTKNTLEYIESKILEAKFPHNIFRSIEKNKKGGNPTGLNAEIAAMVFLFQEKGYFKPTFTFKEVFKAFGNYTENQAGKDYDYSFFSGEYHFKKNLDLLIAIDIQDFSKS